ncbi:hypothetical protein QJS04_geneDACA010441 [Acorus gramineus]|uniref:Uncharacterized protein n=1 Tax=Acorus gramineus TaxID=55184 RepID=A0AAV9A2B8_ACOGR|nr:hypothetical protein QJS04_geneDACA010441 [Acorus gramineus]
MNPSKTLGKNTSTQDQMTVTGDEVAKLEYHSDAVRDCSWHPEYPMLASSSWDGEIARWEFPGSEGVPKPVRRTRRRRAYF